MLKAKKKLSKRELKTDAVVTWMGKATDFYEGYKKNIAIAVGALAVVIIGSILYMSNRTASDAEAAAKLGEVFPLFDSGQYQIAVEGIPERKITGLKSIVDQYSGTNSGNLATFYLANAYYQLGQYDEALKYFEQFDAGEDYLALSRLTGIAGCYEAKGDFAAAAENYEKAALQYPKDVEAAATLNNAAYAYLRAGKNDRALELFKKLKKEYPTTQYAREADRYIARLTA